MNHRCKQPVKVASNSWTSCKRPSEGLAIPCWRCKLRGLAKAMHEAMDEEVISGDDGDHIASIVLRMSLVARDRGANCQTPNPAPPQAEPDCGADYVQVDVHTRTLSLLVDADVRLPVLAVLTEAVEGLGAGATVEVLCAGAIEGADVEDITGRRFSVPLSGLDHNTEHTPHSELVWWARSIGRGSEPSGPPPACPECGSAMRMESLGDDGAEWKCPTCNRTTHRFPRALASRDVACLAQGFVDLLERVKEDREGALKRREDYYADHDPMTCPCCIAADEARESDRTEQSVFGAAFATALAFYVQHTDRLDAALRAKATAREAMDAYWYAIQEREEDA